MGSGSYSRSHSSVDELPEWECLGKTLPIIGTLKPREGREQRALLVGGVVGLLEALGLLAN